MRKSVKKFVIAFLAIVLVFALFVGCGGNYTSKALDGDISGSVKSNGGFVVQKGNYVYFINGSEDYTAKNTFGKVEKGALMRISTADLAAGNYDKTDVVVPLLMVSQDYTSGIYVYGDRVYYATPTSTKNKDGKVENSYIDFKSSKLDASSTMRDYYFRLSNNAAAFRYVEVDDVVYCMYVDTTNKEIHSYNTKTGKDTVLVKNYESYLFDSSDVTNPNVYYTMGVEKKVGYSEGSTNQEKYKQVYSVKADATKSPYEIDLSTDYTDKDSGEVMEYINLGKLVFDGIGASDAVTVFNHNGKNGATGVGYTYTLIKYDNGGLYYTKANTTVTSSVGDGGQLYYIADNSFGSDWNAVTGNDNSANVQLAPDTNSAGASAIFYIENNAHYYMYVNDSAIVRVKVGDSSNSFKAEEVYLTKNASGATLLYIEGEFVYYSVSGTNGNTLNRIKYNGQESEYNIMESADDVIKAEKYLDIEYNSSWYKPEIVAGNVFFADATTYGYNYVYTMPNPATNKDLAELNEKLEKVNDLFTEIAEDYSDISNAAKYYFYTADKDTIKTDDYLESYKEDELTIFDAFVSMTKSSFATDELKDGDKAMNVSTYFYNMIGSMKSSDAEAREDALISLLVKAD